MEKIFEWLTGQYGFIGVSTFVMAGVIVYLFKDGKKEREKMRKEHLEERKEWKATTDKQFDTVVQVTKDNTSALKGIETLIQSIDRRTE